MDKHTPELRFPNFNRSWECLSIQKLVDEKVIDKPLDGNHGNIHPISSDFVEDGIPFVMSNNIQNGIIDFINSKKITKNQADKLQKGFSKSGDVLLTHKGSVGLTAIVPQLEFEYIMLTPQVTYYRVKNHQKLDSKFLLHTFNSPQFTKDLKILADGGTRPYIGITEQRKLLIKLPVIQEQQKIADFLSSVDNKIRLLTEKQNSLQRYKKGVMQKLFPSTGSGQVPELRFKDDNGEDFGDWEETNIGKIADVKGGKRIPKGFSLQSENSGFPYITVSDMFNHSVDTCKIKYVPKEIENKISNYKISVNDIYISVAGTLGLVGIIPDSLNNANLTENANKLTNLKCNQRFLLEYLKSDNFLRLIDSVKTDNAQPKLAIYAIKAFKISLPIKQEQQKIANFLSQIDNKIDTVNQQIEQTKTFKKGLLQQMFV